MYKNERGRTKKEFEPYNDYVDRTFGLKWRTAFAMDELTKTIEASENEFIDHNEKLPQMSREDIDEVLQYAFLKSKTISIQINKYNELGFIADSIVGKFEGFADSDYLYINDKRIAWGNNKECKTEVTPIYNKDWKVEYNILKKKSTDFFY